MLSTAVYFTLTYVVAIIIAAYCIVQVAEMISFILNPHFGIVWKFLWICSITFLGLFGGLFAWVIYDTGRGPPVIEIQWR